MLVAVLLCFPIVVSLARQNLAYGVAAYALAVPLSPELQIGPLSNIRLEDFAALALVMAGGLRPPARPLQEYAVLRRILSLWLAWSALASLLGVLAGSDPVSAVTFLMKRLESLAVFFLVLRRVQRREEILWVVRASLVGVAAAGLWGYVEARAIPIEALYARAAGPDDEPNVFAATLVVGFLMAAALSLTQPLSRNKAVSGGVAALCVPAIVGTLSRAAYLSVGAGAVWLGLLVNRRLLIVSLVLLVTSGSLHAVRDRLPLRVQTRLDRISPERAALERGWAFERAWKDHARSSPVWGTGMGSVRFRSIENMYAVELAQCGCVGLALLLAVLLTLALTLRGNWSVSRRGGDPVLRGLQAGAVAVVAAAAVHGLSGAVLMAIRSSEMFWLWVGLALRGHLSEARQVAPTGYVLPVGTHAPSAPLAVVGGGR